MPRPRGRAMIALVVAGLLGLVPLPSGAQSCAGVSRQSDGWTRIFAPEFEGDSAISQYAVEPFETGRIYVTNGSEVQRTTDGGCSWISVYTAGIPLVQQDGELPDLAVEVLSDIVAVDVAATRDAGDRVYLLVKDSAKQTPASDVAHRARVVVSEDRGENWTDASAGLPPVATPVGLWVAPSSPDQAYVLLVDPTGARRLYATIDGGTSWTPRPDLTQAAGPTITGLTIDPLDPLEVWAWNNDGAFRSTDGGRSFARQPGVVGAVTFVDVQREGPGEADRVLAFGRTGPMFESRDQGRTWSRSTARPLVTGADVAPQGDRYAYVSGDVVRLVDEGKTVDVTPANAAGVSAPEFTRSPGNRLFVNSKNDLYFLDVLSTVVNRPPPPPRGPGNGVVGLPPVDLRAARLRQPGKPFLLPPAQQVPLGLNESVRLDYVLDLPRTPTPLDVMLVFDSTGSMQPLFAGLRNGIQTIVNDLAAMRVDAWFGLADFREYPFHPQALSASEDYPYQLDRIVGPVNEELENAIESVYPDQGTLDGKTSALEATFQAATGFGREVVPTNGLLGDNTPYILPAGQDGQFRPKALKLILLATDIEMRKPGASEPGYPGPSISTVVREMNRLDIGLVGLSLNSSLNGDRRDARMDLDALSRGTGTLAPVDGADCDGDGEIDIEYGKPLVCEMPLQAASTRLATALVAMVDAVQDFQPVELVATAPPGVAVVVPPYRHEAVNVKKDNRLPFQVDVTCDASVANQVVPIGLTALVRGEPAATATVEVACNLPAPLVVPNVVAAVPPPPVAPAQPVPQLNTNANPNPNPNPQTNPQMNPQANPQMNPQAGAAQQEREQFQLATVQGRDARGEQEQLAMSRREAPDPTLALLGSMMAASAATGVVMRRRLQAARAPARAWVSPRR